MPTVRIKWQPSGLINGAPWPAVGETMQLDNEAAVRGMAEAGVIEVVDDAPEKPEPPEDPAKREEPEKAVKRERPQRRRRTQRSE